LGIKKSTAYTLSLCPSSRWTSVVASVVLAPRDDGAGAERSNKRTTGSEDPAARRRDEARGRISGEESEVLSSESEEVAWKRGDGRVSEKEVERDRFTGRRFEAETLSMSREARQINTTHEWVLRTISTLEPGRLDRPVLVLPLE
jgi:hypothetical protein